MNNEKFESVCKNAIAKYGNISQLNQLQEECGELIAAINHLRRNRPNSRCELVLEMADVFIVLYQILGGMNMRIEFENSVDEKIERLNKILND